MAHKTTRTLITEIVMRAVAMKLPALDCKSVEILTDEYTNLVEALVVGVKPEIVVRATSYRTFITQCHILNQIEQEIPVIGGRWEVRSEVTSTQWKEFYGAATVDGDRQGGAEKVDS